MITPPSNRQKILRQMILKNKLAGKFIVLDGPDGCGKSTQCKLLCKWLTGLCVEVDCFRDPGTTIIGEKIRRILLSVEHESMSTRTELLLYMAARAQLLEEKIAPALEENKSVIVDRWLSSTCAYQGYAGGFGIGKVIRIAEDSLERPWPDLTIILDVDLETASKRLNRELDRMEAKGDGYHSKVREGFCELAKIKDNIVSVDACGDIEQVYKSITEKVEVWFK